MFLAVTGILLLMPYNQEQLVRIGEVVRRKRVAKGLNKERAASAAKVNSITWKRVEDAEKVQDASLGKIISSLGVPDVDTLLGAEPIDVLRPEQRSHHRLDDLATSEIVERMRALLDVLRHRYPTGAGITVDNPEEWEETFSDGVSDEPPTVDGRENGEHRDELGGG